MAHIVGKDVLDVRFPTSRELDGSDAMDANQRWDVSTAVERMRALAPFNPYWIEEPTSPDDVLARQAIARQIASIGVAVQ
jgi:L-fuconate dehydratase